MFHMIFRNGAVKENEDPNVWVKVRLVIFNTQQPSNMGE
jgi:hypothetical protein